MLCAMAPLSPLTKAWTAVDANMPRGWRLTVIALGPREADPVIRGPRWAGLARGPDGELAQGEGEQPYRALNDLARKLAPIKRERP